MCLHLRVLAVLFVPTYFLFIVQFLIFFFFFFFSSRRRHTRWTGDWSPDVCSSDLRWSATGTTSVRRRRRSACRRAAACRRRAASTRARPPTPGPKPRSALDWAETCRAAVRETEIGRASCRERVENSEGAGALEKKK